MCLIGWRRVRNKKKVQQESGGGPTLIRTDAVVNLDPSVACGRGGRRVSGRKGELERGARAHEQEEQEEGEGGGGRGRGGGGGGGPGGACHGDADVRVRVRVVWPGGKEGGACLLLAAPACSTLWDTPTREGDQAKAKAAAPPNNKERRLLLLWVVRGRGVA